MTTCAVMQISIEFSEQISEEIKVKLPFNIIKLLY